MSNILVLTEENKTATLNKPLTELTSYADFAAISEQLIGSAFIPSHIPDAATMASILLYGRELGYSPMSAMQNIINISGKLSLTASAMAAAIRNGGIRYTLNKDYAPVYGQVYVDPSDPSKGVKTSDVPTDYITEMTFFERWGDKLIENVMSILWSDAYKIATDNGTRSIPKTYQVYVKQMMTARLLTRAARLFCPEALAGTVYSPSELMMDSRVELTDGHLQQMFDLEEGVDIDGDAIDVEYED